MAKQLKKSPEFSLFFNTLLDICESKGISVTSVIDRFASSRSAMVAWKNGKISTDIIPELALYLNISIDYLLTGREQQTTEQLSSDQQELLKKYNALYPRNQGRVLQFMSDLSEAQSYSSDNTEPALNSDNAKPTAILDQKKHLA